MCFTVELSLEGGRCACTSGQSPSVAAEPLMNPIKKELRKASFPHSFPMRFALTTDNECFRRRCAWGKHPYPSRTRRLRPRRPMVLHWRRCGRAGGCRNPKKKAGESALSDRTDRGGNAEAVNLKQQGSADPITGLYQ